MSQPHTEAPSQPRPQPQSIIGRTLPPFRTTPERSQLQFFAQVIGETDPVYTDVEAARAAGHPDLLVPPTFLFSLELRRPDSHVLIDELGFDRRQFLHGEERFTYHALAYAGEELELTAEYTDCYEKRGGALTFIVRRTTVRREGALIAELSNVLVIRQLEIRS
jgi:acyl dehydratase